MRDIKACVVCFSTEGKLHILNDALRTEFNTVSGLKIVQGNGMPDYLCWECKAYVRKFHSFRERCHRAHYVLRQLLMKDEEIRLSRLSSINRHKLKLAPTISYLPLVQYVTGDNQLNQSTELQREIKIECEDSKTLLQNSGSKYRSSKKMVVNTLGTQTDITDNPNNPMLSKTGVTLESYHPDLEIPSGLEAGFVESQEQTWPLIAVEPLNDPTKVETDDFFDAWDTKRDSETEVFEEMLSYKDDESTDQEYATLVPINSIEARAAVEVFKFTSKGDHECSCGIRFKKEEAYNQHIRKHNKFQSGEYRCDICNIYFKTDFLLGCHFKDNHLYKFVCKSCPEVSFTRTSAKRHYIVKHIQSDINYEHFKNWKTVPNTKWPRNKPRKLKKAMKASPVLPQAWRRHKKLPGDYLVYSPISHEEQYKMVEQRKVSRNYLESSLRCELCYRGYRLASTYNRHMAKHDPKISGKLQCDMCKLHFQSTRKMYKHMISYHLHKYSCRHCDFVCTSKCIALYHYRWHNNVVYDCPHCDRKFTKISSQLTHIRYKHPSTDLCNMCGHSFISVGGLNCHKQMSHTKEEIEMSAALLSNMDPKSQLYCPACNMQFYSEQAYTTHLSSSSKHVDTNFAVNRSEAGGRCAERSRNKSRSVRGRPRRAAPASEILNNGTSTANNCEVCGIFLANDVSARKHYDAEHPGTDYLKRYMCDVCGHTTKQYANLLVHMRVHTQEKPYSCPHCDRKFSLPSNRDRHLVVHTGEKRYQCQHCSRRFTQSTAVKLHIQTVHLKIPYKPWDKKNRKRRKDNQNNANTQSELAAVLAPVSAPPHKLLLDPQAEYITYIAYPEQ